VFGENCKNAEKDLVKEAFADAVKMSELAPITESNYTGDPAFWELFGPNAQGNGSSIIGIFKHVKENDWHITASCDLSSETTECKDKYMYGGIGEITSGADSSPSLVFCGEFFTFPTLEFRLQMGLNNPINWTARFDLGYYHENQGTVHPYTLEHDTNSISHRFTSHTDALRTEA
jgi:hypothetical protein